MKLSPLFDRVLIDPKQTQAKTTSGLILPESNTEKPMYGTVLKIGNGFQYDGNKVDMQVKPGDTVIYSRFGGIEIKLNEKTLIIIRQSDILAILEGETNE